MYNITSDDLKVNVKIQKQEIPGIEKLDIFLRLLCVFLWENMANIKE